MLTIQAFYDWRCNQIKQFRETKQPDPYPHKFHVTQSVPSFIRQWGAEGKLESGVTSEEGEPVSLAGRVMTIRESSAKLRFYDLRADGQKVQIMASAS